jgi:hypothetical protein
MQHWLAATLIGVSLGLALYACVRLRMYFGPIVRDRYGHWARRAYWMATILIMVVLANLGLSVLRIYLGKQAPILDSLMYEICFALFAFAIPLVLIFRRVGRNR